MTDDYFKKAPWKVEHRNDGASFIAIPYKYKGGTVKDAWVIGPLEKDIAEWLFDAIIEKQKTSKVARDFLYDPPV